MHTWTFVVGSCPRAAACCADVAVFERNKWCGCSKNALLATIVHLWPVNRFTKNYWDEKSLLGLRPKGSSDNLDQLRTVVHFPSLQSGVSTNCLGLIHKYHMHNYFHFTSDNPTVIDVWARQVPLYYLYDDQPRQHAWPSGMQIQSEGGPLTREEVSPLA